MVELFHRENPQGESQGDVDAVVLAVVDDGQVDAQRNHNGDRHKKQWRVGWNDGCREVEPHVTQDVHHDGVRAEGHDQPGCGTHQDRTGGTWSTWT